MDNNLIIWSDIAVSDLNGILEYINQNAGEERALYVLTGIKGAISKIFPFPHKFAREPLFNNNNVRYTVKWNYKIIYKIFNDYVEIVRIFHSSQNPSKLIKE
jgi:plasmid stabilization system protein ParE